MEVNLKGVNVKLTPEKAVLIGNTAVISDLHLGYEEAMRKNGIYFPRFQINEIKLNLKKLFNRKIKRLIVAGDLKHEFGYNLHQEWKDVEEFVEFVTPKVELIVLRGNHDNYLKSILKNYGIDLLESFSLGEIEVIHGHLDKKVESAILGHEHPSIKLRIRGSIYNYPCFLRVKNFLVLPAFSPLMSGSDILTLNAFLSPMLKKIDPEESEVYAICDGIFYLGKVKQIKAIS